MGSDFVIQTISVIRLGGALRGFAALMESESIAGMNVRGIDSVQLAASMGCPGAQGTAHADLAQALARAYGVTRPRLVEVPIDPSIGKIY